MLAKMQDTALDLGEEGRDDYCGDGLVSPWLATQRPMGDVNIDNYVNARDAVIMGRTFDAGKADSLSF